MSDYTGISIDAMMLLAENRFNDSKTFYEEHKPAIKKGVQEPLKQLIAHLEPSMDIVDPLVKGSISRVRRDSRFTHDKRMYRENMWITFMRDKRAWNWCVPAFYLDFSLNGASWGVGFWSATPAVMTALRRIADADPKRVLKALADGEMAGFALYGQPYARPRHPEGCPPALQPIYNCKHIGFSREESPAIMAEPTLPEKLETGFAALTPFYHLLTEAMEIANGIKEV